MRLFISYLLLLVVSFLSGQDQIGSDGDKLRDNFMKLIQSDSIINYRELGYKENEENRLVLISLEEIGETKYFLKVSIHNFQIFRKNNLLKNYYYEYIKDNGHYYVLVAEKRLPIYDILNLKKTDKMKIFKSNYHKKRDKYYHLLPTDWDTSNVQLLSVSNLEILNYKIVAFQGFYPYSEDIEMYEYELNVEIN